MREEDTIQTIIAQAQASLREIKQKQFAGSSNITAVESQSNLEWDIDQNITLTPGESFIIPMWFIADTQEAPFADIRPEIRINNAPVDTQQIGIFVLAPGSVLQQTLTALKPSQDQLRRMVSSYLYNFDESQNKTINFKLKVRAIATDTGTVGAAVTNG